jgi:hypothetical protein
MIAGFREDRYYGCWKDQADDDDENNMFVQDGK